MIYQSKTIARAVALEWLASQGVTDLDIRVTAIEDGFLGDEIIVRYSVALPRFGKSHGALFIPNSFYLFRAWELAHSAEKIAA
jgi:hypothetical protein